MKKKSLIMLSSTILMSLSLPILSNAQQWITDGTGWQFQKDDGTYIMNQWEWLDPDNDGTAECYYFNESGYCLMDTTTPDNYTVNERGAWTVNGAVQTKVVEARTYVTENGMERYALEGRYYAPEANPYINDATYQVIRNELFAKLQEKLSLSPLGDYSRRFYTYLVCQSVSFSTKEEEEKILNMTRQVCYEIADYINENTGEKIKEASAARFLAGGDLGGSSHNPGIEFKIY